jgi:hypothetical protein
MGIELFCLIILRAFLHTHFEFDLSLIEGAMYIFYIFIPNISFVMIYACFACL